MKLHFLVLSILVSLTAYSQTPEEFTVAIEPFEIAGAPGIHSYSWGMTSDQKWIIIGGRIDGLHRRQPFAAFLDEDNNRHVYVIDPQNENVWSAPISVLPAPIFEQLKSTNQQFYQDSNTLYIIGGYGYSATSGDHITFPNITAIAIDELANAVINQNSIIPCFRQSSDNNLKVTGGQLGYLNGYYYLVGGQLFDGRYNPMGPTHGPGFTQIYTDEIRKFQIVDDGVNLSIQNFSAIHDSANLHRRDYNMCPQIFPDGTKGFTAFSGVFNPNDLPWLTCVNVHESTYEVIPSFYQYLSHYHSAEIPVHDAAANTMHTLFFGGMSQYYIDDQNTLLEDENVPFVKTISRVTRYSDWSMEETELSYIEMPALVGSGAEFIPVNTYFSEDGILDLNAVPSSKTLVGYIYGGIESSDENIFFVNTGTESSASNVIFKVYIDKSTVSDNEISIGGREVFDPIIYPVPTRNTLNVEFNLLRVEEISINIVDSDGKIVEKTPFTAEESGWQKIKLSTKNLKSGNYYLVITNGKYSFSEAFVKK